jgi:hypothetical protein
MSNFSPIDHVTEQCVGIIEAADKTFAVRGVGVRDTDGWSEDASRLAGDLYDIDEFSRTDQTPADRRGPRNNNVHVLESEINNNGQIKLQKPWISPTKKKKIEKNYKIWKFQWIYWCNSIFETAKIIEPIELVWKYRSWPVDYYGTSHW